MEYLLVFVTLWSLNSEPNGSWDHTEYVWNEDLLSCKERAKLKISNVKAVQRKQLLKNIFGYKTAMKLKDHKFYCWSEKEVKEFHDAERKRLDGDT